MTKFQFFSADKSPLTSVLSCWLSISRSSEKKWSISLSLRWNGIVDSNFTFQKRHTKNTHPYHMCIRTCVRVWVRLFENVDFICNFHVNFLCVAGCRRDKINQWTLNGIVLINWMINSFVLMHVFINPLATAKTCRVYARMANKMPSGLIDRLICILLTLYTLYTFLCVRNNTQF